MSAAFILHPAHPIILRRCWSPDQFSHAILLICAMLLLYLAIVKSKFSNDWQQAGRPAPEHADAFAVSSFSGEQVQTFIGFISADGKNIANSIYTGAVTVL